MNRKELAQYLTAGASGPNQFVERDTQMQLHDKDAALKKYLQSQEPAIAGQKQAAQNKANLDTVQTPEAQDMIRKGGSVKAGDLAFGADPYAHLMSQGPHQAQAFLKNAQGAYKNINDQLDSQRATLDALDQGNAQGDRLAYINEARIAAGSGGSRALGQILSQLHGDPSMASDTQKALNWIQNTPNLPTMQPAERDALRETVFNRTGQLAQQHSQAKAALAQQGPAIAPYADTNTLLQSVTTPIDQKLADVQSRQKAYQTARQKMAPQPPISQPAAANANPTTLDKLKSFFGMGQSAQAPAAPQGGKVKVRRKADGATGTMDASDPAVQSGAYEVVQ